MYTFSESLLRRSLVAALFLALIVAPCFNFSTARADLKGTIIYWVFDVSTADSQFGYWDETTSRPVGGIFAGRDFEGLACIGSTIFVTSGGDGNRPSQLARLALNITADTTSITDIGNIQTAGGTAFYEVASLAMRPSDNTLWAYAAEIPTGAAGRGIIKIDPATGTAQLILAADLDVAALTWFGNTLYLAAGNDVYSWTEGGALSNSLYEINGLSQIEAMDTSPNQTLYIGGDGTNIMEINPTTGAVINGNVFKVTDRQGATGDPESLTFCQAPTALEDEAEPLQMAPQIFFPAVMRSRG